LLDVQAVCPYISAATQSLQTKSNATKIQKQLLHTKLKGLKGSPYTTHQNL